MKIQHETLVFNLWVVPEYASRWAKATTTPICQMDIQSGSIRILMTGPDGCQRPMGGYFREVSGSGRLVFTPFRVNPGTAFSADPGTAFGANPGTVFSADPGTSFGAAQWTQRLERLEALLLAL